ncbi:unnamed protein product [Alopecurus aequalis]
MPHHALAELARSMRAPLLHVRLGSITAVVISKPDLARASLTTNDAALASRPHLLSAQILSFGCSDVTLAPAGPYHRMARGVVVSELLSARRVTTYGRARVSEVRRLLAHVATKSTSPETPVDLSACLFNMANDVLCRVAFGRRFPRDKGDRLAAVLAEAQNLFAGFTIGDFFPELEPIASTVTGLRRRLNKCYADLRAICENIVDDHISKPMRLQEEEDSSASRRYVHGRHGHHVVDDGVGDDGARPPSPVLRKAQDEVRRVVGAKGHVEESHLGGLRYLRAIIKEAFRLHPTVPLLVPRESVAPCSLGGYDIPAKTRVFINTFAMGRDPEIWENPLQFSPERFGGKIDLKDHDYRLLPFGAGRRGCPGYTFAQATMELTLASLLYHFEWALPAGVRTEDVSLQETFGLASKKRDPLLVAVTKNHEYEFKGEELQEH